MTSRRIAVIGGGVAGLTAGYVLARTGEVTLFEADSRLGGHAHTHRLAEADGRELAVTWGLGFALVALVALGTSAATGRAPEGP